ncbi:MAG: tetratricopeptide repeat protein [Acidobacteriota bacterium]
MLLALAISQPAIGDSTTPSQDQVCETLVSKAKALKGLSRQETLQHALARCQQPEVSPEVRAKAVVEAGWILDLNEQIRLYSSSVQLLREEAPNSEFIPKTLVKLATAVTKQGRAQEGLEYAEESLAERERLFGEASREYLRGLIVVGVAHSTSDGDAPTKPHLTTGYDYLQEAVRSATEHFGPKDPTTVSAKIQLALILREMGRYADAEALDDEILDLEFDEGW